MKFYLERAAIIEIDGGRPRPDADYAAIIRTRVYCDRHSVDCPDTPDFKLLLGCRSTRGCYTSRRSSEDDMLNSDDWQKEVVKEGVVMCRACGAPHPTMGACAIGAMTIHQEYICEQCGHAFTALYALVGCYDGIGDT